MGAPYGTPTYVLRIRGLADDAVTGPKVANGAPGAYKLDVSLKLGVSETGNLTISLE